MKIFDRIRDYIQSRNWKNRGLLKYIIILVFFLAAIMIGEDTNIFMYIRNEWRIRQLKNSIEELDQSAQKTQKEINELQTNKEVQEKFAREKYLMHEADEVIYVIKEDSL